MDLTAFISREGDELVTDSRAVALAFGKQHSKVIRTIKQMIFSDHAEIAKHGRANFGESSYVNAQGKTQPMYRMTADGLSELAMSFTGDLSRIVRIRFIAAFREVARRLDSAEKTITQMLHDHEKRAAGGLSPSGFHAQGFQIGCQRIGDVAGQPADDSAPRRSSPANACMRRFAARSAVNLDAAWIAA